MIESRFMFACLARMRVPSFMFPGRLRFAGNIFMAQGLSPRMTTRARNACIGAHGLFGERRCIPRAKTPIGAQCNSRTRAPANRQKRRRKTVKRDQRRKTVNRDWHRNLLFTAGLSQILLSATRTPLARIATHPSRRWICARVVRHGNAYTCDATTSRDVLPDPFPDVCCWKFSSSYSSCLRLAYKFGYV